MCCQLLWSLKWFGNYPPDLFVLRCCADGGCDRFSHSDSIQSQNRGTFLKDILYSDTVSDTFLKSSNETDNWFTKPY